MKNIVDKIKSSTLEYHEKREELAYEAENMLDYIRISSKTKDYMERKIICDIFEGSAPYRPRYVLPDYKKVLEVGSGYLNLDPAKNMYEAISSLLIFYNYVPSITGKPVYIGQIDELLEPFVDTISEGELDNLLTLFLNNIDRIFANGFVHMNIGPRNTTVGKKVLEIERKLKNAVPNTSFKFSNETPEELIKMAAENALEIGKPYIVNHDEVSKIYGTDYGVASCFNTLKIGGGSLTLARLNLKELALCSTSYEDFLNSKLVDAIDSLCELIIKRSEFIVEEAKFFESCFLSREGFIHRDKFTSMAGVFGLYECVEFISKGLKLGVDEEANEMAVRIIDKAYECVKQYKLRYAIELGQKIGFHAQSGIDTDLNTTAGVRLRVGEEVDLFSQIKIEGRLQHYFDTGVSDIYIFESTAKKNIQGVLKIIKGAMKNGNKIIALNTSDSELVRITGYLVKKSDLEKYQNGESVRESTVMLGAGSIKNGKILDRKVVKSSEGSY